MPQSTAPPRPRTALITLSKAEAGSMVVTDHEERPVGMFTLHDLLRINILGISLDTPIGQVMSTRLVTLPRQAPAWEAALAMTRHRIHYVLVVDGGRLLGVISGRDLFALQRIGLPPLSTLLHEAKSLDDLVQAAADIRLLAGTLVDQGVEAEQITHLISNLNDQLTLRIFQLECTTAECTNIEFCWISLGSEGRYEQTLFTDQDNAIVFPDPPGGARAAAALRARLLPVAQRINEILDRCSFPLCKGGIMASNPQWCLSLSEWKDTFADWIHRGDAPVLLNATIFLIFAHCTAILPWSPNSGTGSTPTSSPIGSFCANSPTMP
ncbi:CBS domain-containing protein [Gammaproteobacteria bacterium]